MQFQNQPGQVAPCEVLQFEEEWRRDDPRVIRPLLDDEQFGVDAGGNHAGMQAVRADEGAAEVIGVADVQDLHLLVSCTVIPVPGQADTAGQAGGGIVAKTLPRLGDITVGVPDFSYPEILIGTGKFHG